MIVLSMASGACGTGYVSEILSTLNNHSPNDPDIVVRWEPKTYSNKLHICAVNHCNDKEVLETCWKNIHNRMLNLEKLGKGLYIEISHRLIKGWLYKAAEEIEDLRIINLHRDFVSLARTLYLSRRFKNINWQPRSLLEPNWAHVLTKLPNWEVSTHLERVVWYIMEIEERKKKFMKDHPHIPVVTFSMSDRTLEGWQPVLDFIGRKPTERTLKYLSADRKVNPWTKKTSGGDHSITDDEIKAAINNHKFIYNDKEVNI